MSERNDSHAMQRDGTARVKNPGKLLFPGARIAYDGLVVELPYRTGETAPSSAGAGAEGTG